MSQYIVKFEGNINFLGMNAAEIKLDLFRKIDNLTEPELEKVYRKSIALLSTTSSYMLSKDEKAAIDEAMEVSKNSQTYSREEVMHEAKQKYPNLKFK